MTFQPTSRYIKAPDDSTIVWRYLSFFTFVELIHRRKLRFTRADRFKDPLEGMITSTEGSTLSALYRERSISTVPEEELITNLTPIASYVSCWREGDQESMAMWDLYNKGEGTVAVTSTVGLIKEVLQQEPEECSVGRVDYIPWKTHDDLPDAFYRCFRKDLSYQHELEIRAVLHRFRTTLSSLREGEPFEQLIARIPEAVELDIELTRFITGVVVGPEQGSRSFELIRSIVEQYSLPWAVRSSELLKKPEF
jgi:hypothetical protein